MCSGWAGVLESEILNLGGREDGSRLTGWVEQLPTADCQLGVESVDPTAHPPGVESVKGLEGDAVPEPEPVIVAVNE